MKFNHLHSKRLIKQAFSTAETFLRKDHAYPSIAIAIVMIFVIHYANELAYWKHQNHIIANDVIHYYAYLPAVFVYEDIKLDFIAENPSDYVTKFWPVHTPLDKRAIMTTMGMSMMYAPAFLTTHLLVMLSGGEADGFSTPYRLGLVVGGWIYLFLSLLLLKKMLRQFFSPLATAIAIIVTVLGTNLFHYATAETTMTHAYSFFLFSLFLWLTIKWHKKPTLTYSAFIGLVSGLIVLVRPTNIIIGLVFLLWNVKGFSDLKANMQLFLRNFHLVFVLVVCAFIVWIPQFLYWKMVAGTYLYYSYGDEQGFFFGNPQIWNSLFSYRKGWIVYTPAILFAFAGLFFMLKNRKGLFIPLMAFTIINIYIISSWWAWWYGGGFGLRAYVESYALYAIGFGAFANWSIHFKKWIWLRSLLLLIVLLLIYLNQFQTHQYRNGSIHYVGMNKEAYWHSFLKPKPDREFYNKLTIPDYEKARKGIYEFNPLNDNKEE